MITRGGAPYDHVVPGPVRLESHKVVTIDCDDTLVMWQESKYQDLERVLIGYGEHTNHLRINQKNVNLAIKLHKLGYKLVIWSRTGFDWAEAVGKALGIHERVSFYMTKPLFAIDDQPFEKWCTRIWRDPITGESES